MNIINATIINFLNIIRLFKNNQINYFNIKHYRNIIYMLYKDENFQIENKLICINCKCMDICVTINIKNIIKILHGIPKLSVINFFNNCKIKKLYIQCKKIIYIIPYNFINIKLFLNNKLYIINHILIKKKIFCYILSILLIYNNMLTWDFVNFFFNKKKLIVEIIGNNYIFLIKYFYNNICCINFSMPKQVVVNLNKMFNFIQQKNILFILYKKRLSIYYGSYNFVTCLINKKISNNKNYNYLSYTRIQFDFISLCFILKRIIKMISRYVNWVLLNIINNYIYIQFADLNGNYIMDKIKINYYFKKDFRINLPVRELLNFLSSFDILNIWMYIKKPNYNIILTDTNNFLVMIISPIIFC